MPILALTCHPATLADVACRVTARVRRTRGGMLTLVYVIKGGVDRVRWPPPGPSRRADDLWRHGCCEMFLAEYGRTGYYEYNFAPSTAWALYRFSAYREGMPVVENIGPPRIASRARADRLVLAARVDLKALSPRLAGADLRLAVSVVIETTDGRCSYWALRHPAGRPDFHHPGGFTLALAPD